MTNKPISRQTHIVVQDLENEVLIYDLTINKAFCLNETSALVYTLADGTKTVTEISDLMSVKLKMPVIEEVVYLALNELGKANLLETEKEFTNYFGGVSRREIVKRVGLASMIALPLVTGVIAPTAAQAASTACTLNAPGCVASGSFATSTQPSDAVCSGPNGFAACCSCARTGYIYVITTQSCSVRCA